MNIKNCFLSLVFLAACSHQPPQASEPNQVSLYTFKDLPNLPHSKIQLGGFSGLVYEGRTADGKLNFMTHTDRGANGDIIKQANGSKLRPFLLPGFQLEWVKFQLSPDGAVKISDRIGLRNQDKSKITGVGSEGDTIATNGKGKPLKFDPRAIDPEALTKDTDGTYWMVDEYGPDILHLDANGVTLSRWTAPAPYTQRRPNRGFEGVAVDDSFVYAILQSPLSNELGKARILVLDKKTGKHKADYFYPFEPTSEGQSPVDKIGDMTMIPTKDSRRQFLVIEQNSEVGPTSFRRIYKITLQQPGQPVKKQLVADLTQLGFANIEKAEGLTYIDQNTIAVINDNDFNLVRPTENVLAIIHLSVGLDK